MFSGLDLLQPPTWLSCQVYSIRVVVVLSTISEFCCGLSVGCQYTCHHSLRFLFVHVLNFYLFPFGATPLFLCAALQSTKSKEVENQLMAQVEMLQRSEESLREQLTQKNSDLDKASADVAAKERQLVSRGGAYAVLVDPIILSYAHIM